MRPSSETGLLTGFGIFGSWWVFLNSQETLVSRQRQLRRLGSRDLEAGERVRAHRCPLSSRPARGCLRTRGPGGALGMSHRPICHDDGPGGRAPRGAGPGPRRGFGGDRARAGPQGSGTRSGRVGGPGAERGRGRHGDAEVAGRGSTTAYFSGLPGSQRGAQQKQVSLCEATVCPTAETTTVKPLRNTF